MLEQLLTALVMMIGSYRPEAVTRLVLLACAVLRTRRGHEQGHLSREQYLRTCAGLSYVGKAGKGNWIVAVCCTASVTVLVALCS